MMELLLLLGLIPSSPLPFGACFNDSLSAHGSRVMQLEHVVCEPCTALDGIEWCAAQCRAANYSLAGVEAGHECVCGNALADPTALTPPEQCDTPCVSNPHETCGGMFRLYAANVSAVPPPPPPPPDFLESRDIRAGTLVLEDNYLDQCYCVVNERVTPVTWTCVITADSFHEGGHGEHIESLVSTDRGKSWSRHKTVEPDNMTPRSLPNAYAVIALAPRAGPKRTGRVYTICERRIEPLPVAAIASPADRTAPSWCRQTT